MMTVPLKVLIDRNLNPEKDLTEDSYVLGRRRNKTKIVLPVMKKEETRYDISKARPSNR